MLKMIALITAASAGLAAQTLVSTTDLKQACESSPTNTVTITQPTKIDQGARYPAVEVVNTGCTIFMGANMNFELSEVSMKFNGPLQFQEHGKSDVSFMKSLVEASSMNFPLYRRGSKLKIFESRLVANAGNFSIGFFEDALLEVVDAFPSLPSAPVIQTSGQFSVFTDASTLVFKKAPVRAGTGIIINLADELPTLAMEETDLRTTLGSITIVGTNRDIKAEIKKGVFSAPNGVSVTLTGRNSAMAVSDLTVQGGSGLIKFGVGSYSATAELKQTIMQTAGNIEFASGSFWSTLVVDGSRLTAGGSVTAYTGSQGSKVVANNNTGSAGTAFSVTYGGPASACDASGNTVSAPVQRICQISYF